MATHLYGRRPDVFAKLTYEFKRPVIIKIFANIRQGIRFETSCWLAEVSPEEFTEAMDQDPHLFRAVMREFAKAEKAQFEILREGGPGMSKAKAALEILERTIRGWSRKSSIDLSAVLSDGLAELKKQFVDGKTFSGPEAYELTVKILMQNAG